MPTPETLRAIADWRRIVAGDALTPRHAKLYSQRLRREMGQPGLATFAQGDVSHYLDEALWLLDLSLIERGAAPEGEWRKGIKRAAEVLEFLSQTELRPQGAPIHLLAAAAYQVAGFPAMALAQLATKPDDGPVSEILWQFLRADFPKTLEQVRQFWRDQRLRQAAPVAPDGVSGIAIQHVAMCIGTVCMYIRTGEQANAERAIRKLQRLADGYLLSRDPFSYLLARLVALASANFVESSIWRSIQSLQNDADEPTRLALQQYARSAFVNRRALVWPSQSAGVQRLNANESFVLCTPTGSGKTTVATLAAVQGLFTRPARPRGLEALEPDNLILYIVPSRALAAEVEKRLSEDLRGIAARPVVVTGLYGGIDWGPTDAWIQTDGPTVVICTFEKADALLRYLGVLFMHRVRLVIIDEAHMVEHSGAGTNADSGDSRALRLELLGTRLSGARDQYRFRMIALSAVAATAAPALARWVVSDREALPTSSTHRSTRQMLGRIEVGSAGQFSIHYDLMDGRSLRFDEQQRAQTPFVTMPFPPLPAAPDFSTPEKPMQAASLWAAMHLASERRDGTGPSVLISVTHNVSSFADECAVKLDEWPADRLPRFKPEGYEGDAGVQRCLAIAADYFGETSAEYRLLQRGVAVHHGKMPGLLGRRLKGLMDRGMVRVIIATSTLSEGVNIPVSYLLIPNIYRATDPLSFQEFTNLIGRVGRPGVSTEGHALVMLPEVGAMPFDERGRRRTSRQRREYGNLIARVENAANAGIAGQLVDNAASPLSELLYAIEQSWLKLVPGGTAEQFTAWLEQTVVVDNDVATKAVQHLDSLDAFLIASIHELEEIQAAALVAVDLEEQLIRIWRRSYAFAAAQDEERLRRIWLGRGRAIQQIYPDRAVRRQIYRSSLSPRSALRLAARVEAIRDRLLLGARYVALSTEDRLTFVGDVIALIAEVPSFGIGRNLGRAKDFDDWRSVLRWWLAKHTVPRNPTAKQVAQWYAFASQNFIYKGAWGLGSVLSLLLDVQDGGGPIAAIEIDDWPRSGLPWIAFWLKELLTWGTLEPVAAYLLARGDAIDRLHAEEDALAYYQQLPNDIDDNDKLDPRRIRAWLNQRVDVEQQARPPVEFGVDVTLAREPAAYIRPVLDVMPIDSNGGLTWIEPAGYVVATSLRPRDWPDAPERYQFRLDIAAARTSGSIYQPHRQ